MPSLESGAKVKVKVYAHERALREEPVRELTNHPDSSKFLKLAGAAQQAEQSIKWLKVGLVWLQTRFASAKLPPQADPGAHVTSNNNEWNIPIS
eukprot:1146076-Pelagomonas_calceolata.AAC.5